MSEPNTNPPPPQQPPPYAPVEPLPYATPGGVSGSGGPPYLGPPPTTDDRNLATLAHVLGILTSFVGPLVIWMVKKDQSPFVADQGREALNFQITLLIGYAICAVATVICIGPFIAIGLSVVAIVFGILGAVAASKGEAYRYPLNIRLIT